MDEITVRMERLRNWLGDLDALVCGQQLVPLQKDVVWKIRNEVDDLLPCDDGDMDGDIAVERNLLANWRDGLVGLVALEQLPLPECDRKRLTAPARERVEKIRIDMDVVLSIEEVGTRKNQFETVRVPVGILEPLGVV